MDSDSEYSRESSSDVYASTLKENLESYIENVESTGSFALFTPVNLAPNPGLFIKGAGTIGLPLSDRDAQSIVAASHQAPFGKGSQTVVDVSVRRTWELSPGEFEIKNPAWDAFVSDILPEVQTGLGISEEKGVSAELYKLLLYDEGAMFKPHQDSEKAPRMFGTLVIALPSSHQGGEVIATHAGKTKTLSTSEHSDFNFSWMAWYSDVTHEVRSVTAGRRLVLTYNLVHTTATTKASAQASLSQVQGFKDLLNSWDMKVTPTTRTGFAYILEHKYSDASIRFENLKGRDQQVVSLLRTAAEDGHHFVYLANIEHLVSGGCEEEYDIYYQRDGSSGRYHDITEETERSLKCSVVVNLNGGLIAKNLDIEHRDIIQESPFEYEDPDEEDYEGYTGNAGTSATHYYRRTVSIWATSYCIYLLSPDLKNLSKKVIELYVKCNGGSFASGQSRESISPFTKNVLETVWQVAVDVLKDESLVKSAWSFCGRETGNRYFELGSAICRYGLANLLPDLRVEILTLKNFSERMKALRNLAAALSQMKLKAAVNKAPSFQGAEDMISWIRRQALQAVDTLPLETAEDGKELLNLEWLAARDEVFSLKVIPAVRRNITKVPMVTQFLSIIFERGPPVASHGTLSITVILQELLKDFSDSLRLQSNHYEPPPMSTLQQKPPQPLQPVAHVDEARNLAVVLCEYLAHGLSDNLQKILTKLSEDAKTLSINSFQTMLLPTLKAILSLLKSRNLSTSSESPFANLFKSILASYICRYVGNEPSPPTNWTLPKRGCSTNCHDCHDLDAFLIDPRQSVGRFSVNQKRRTHLERHLSRIDCTHQTSRTGNPLTLVVTKTRGRYIAAISEYKERHALAVKCISDLGVEELRGLLGEYFSDIIEGQPTLPLRRLQAGWSALAGASGNRGRPAAERVLPPISRRKIPGGGTVSVYDSSNGGVEVVDITSDTE